jgi:hypothetical protein
MEDNFNIHKWNKDRYLKEVGEEPYRTAMQNLAAKAGIEYSNSPNKMLYPYIVASNNDNIEVRATNDLKAINKALENGLPQDNELLVINNLTNIKSKFKYNINTNQYEKI